MEQDTKGSIGDGWLKHFDRIVELEKLQQARCKLFLDFFPRQLVLFVTMTNTISVNEWVVRQTEEVKS